MVHELSHPRYPRSDGYDPYWVLTNQMGPNALWLLESLTEVMSFEPGMKVLDLGCGKAMTSIFLAKEFGVDVWATDLWIPAAENQAIDRAHRIGQDKPVLVFRLISEGTVEERVIRLQERKRALAEGVYGVDDAKALAELSADDILGLFAD